MENVDKHERRSVSGVRPLPVADSRSAGPPPWLDSGDEVNLLEYWVFLKPWRRKILAAMAVALLLTFLLDTFVRTHWYRAQAILRPASQEGPTSPLAVMLGSSSITSGLSSLMGATGLSQTPNDAAEHIAILSSYDFTTSLVTGHNLGPILDRKSLLGQLLAALSWPVRWVEVYIIGEKKPDPRWSWYKKMTHRFDSDYDTDQGNLTVQFMDPDPAVAKQILGYYVDALREKLRGRAVQSATLATKSLEEEVAKTSDSLLIAQLDQLIAQQLQEEKTAQVQADFAFTVVEPPYVPDEIYKPKLLLDCAIVGVLTPLAACLWIFFFYHLYQPAREAERLAAAAAGNGLDAPLIDAENEDRSASKA